MERYMRNRLIAGIAVVLVAVLAVSIFPSNISGHSVEGKREKFISLREEIQGDLMPQGKYRCCLEKPCTYCIEKSPGHGEGAVCDCLSDIINGKHPCGECIGEILEGHGNPYLAEYFARAIAEEAGEEHIDSLRLMISQKYLISIEEQF